MMYSATSLAHPFGLWRDRAAVLEDSWRNRYRDVVVAASMAAAPPSCQGLDCPFLTLQPRKGHWIPLLVLNGASEATGGRIVASGGPELAHELEAEGYDKFAKAAA